MPSLLDLQTLSLWGIGIITVEAQDLAQASRPVRDWRRPSTENQPASASRYSLVIATHRQIKNLFHANLQQQLHVDRKSARTRNATSSYSFNSISNSPPCYINAWSIPCGTYLTSLFDSSMEPNTMLTRHKNITKIMFLESERKQQLPPLLASAALNRSVV